MSKKKIEVSDTSKPQEVEVKVAKNEVKPLVPGVKVIFYRFGCGCGKEDIRIKIRNKIMSLGGETMKDYHERRVEYDQDWMKQAKDLGLTNCGFDITWPDGTRKTLTLPEFLEAYIND